MSLGRAFVLLAGKSDVFEKNVGPVRRSHMGLCCLREPFFGGFLEGTAKGHFNFEDSYYATYPHPHKRTP